MPIRNPANAYQGQAINTATPTQLLVMLCDRLAVDIDRAEVAIIARDFKESNDNLQHAQAIVRMLRTSLDPTGFKGGEELLSLYYFLERQLAKANLEKSVEIIHECAEVFAPIHEAWRRAVHMDEGSHAISNLG